MSTIDAITAATARDRRLIAAWHGEDPVDEPDKAAALLDVARVLTAADVSYAPVGGVAVGVHSGVPRATQDTDVAIPSTADREAVARSMVGAGFRPRCPL